MCVHVCVHVCACICTCVHVSLCVRVSVHACACVCVHMYMCACVCMCLCVSACVCTHVRVCMCLCMCVHACVCVCVCYWVGEAQPLLPHSPALDPALQPRAASPCSGLKLRAVPTAHVRHKEWESTCRALISAGHRVKRATGSARPYHHYCPLSNKRVLCTHPTTPNRGLPTVPPAPRTAQHAPRGLHGTARVYGA